MTSHVLTGGRQAAIFLRVMSPHAQSGRQAPIFLRLMTPHTRDREQIVHAGILQMRMTPAGLMCLYCSKCCVVTRLGARLVCLPANDERSC